MKKVGNLSEDAVISRFFAPISPRGGDDGALLTPEPGRDLLVSTDALIEDVHFLRTSKAEWVAQKAVRANLSDIVAGGGSPCWLTLSLSLPPALELEWLARFSEGLSQALLETGVELVGGDTTRAINRIAISLTIIGQVATGKAVTRQGALAGHCIGVTGGIGDAALGLKEILGEPHGLKPEAAAHFERRHFHPPYRHGFSISAAPLFSAMMDLSDGLAIDLPRLCAASGVGAVLDLETLPVTKAMADTDWAENYRFLLEAGEDYELLFTCSESNIDQIRVWADKTETPIAFIGAITAESGVRYREKGKQVDITPVPWNHFKA